ncbi:MAG: PmoA family protein [Sedimentisphaerales bacterium]|nr:PmoA family protein [Sedimentisphaerales bacterium]
MERFGRNRREFLRNSLYFGATAAIFGPLTKAFADILGDRMKFGLVTYLWGQDWDIPTLIANCTKTKVLGAELRTAHAHKVESNLNADQRAEVKKRFADSPVTLVGLGTNFAFHHTDPDRLRQDIAGAKEYLKLSADVGGSGIKVKPNDLPKDVPQEKTIEQIGKSLNEIAEYGAAIGQQVRLEVHGGCSPLPIIKAIMDVADNPNATVCWNSNMTDIEGEGLEHNFNLVKHRFGDTVHVWDLDAGQYPYDELAKLFVRMDYAGWILLEARAKKQDRVAAMVEQRLIWEGHIAKAQSRSHGVNITRAADKLKVEIDGRLFTEYNYQNVPRPFFYPVIGPTGVNITRHWPMKSGKDEEQDHVHHRSLWFTHGEVNGHDFWGEGAGSGKVVQDRIISIDNGVDTAAFKTHNNWVAKNGKTICTDTRTHTFRNTPEGPMIDFEITIHASEGKVVMGDTKEGSMALRLAPTMRVEGKVGKGHILNSAGDKDGSAWGKRAKWCDYYGPLDGQTVGVAIFDHPENPKHPTWWHVRTYGLFAANPFGVHDFERKQKGLGDIVIEQGKSLTFKYRIYFHKGDTKQANVAARYAEYSADKD